MRLYYREELEGLVSTLRDLFNPRFRKEEGFLLHKEGVLSAHPFLQEVFEVIDGGGNWENVLEVPPGKVEVTLLPTQEIDKRHLLTSEDIMLMFPLSKDDKEFLEVSSDGMLTLFISLPRGCIQEPDSRDGKLLWGAEVPNKFFFSQSSATAREGVPRYRLVDISYPYR